MNCLAGTVAQFLNILPAIFHEYRLPKICLCSSIYKLLPVQVSQGIFKVQCLPFYQIFLNLERMQILEVKLKLTSSYSQARSETVAGLKWRMKERGRKSSPPH